jgi:hypothetical protein
MLSQPFSEVATFVKRQAALGRYRSATAANLIQACARVQEVLEDSSDTVGYVREHLDDLITRYGNLNPKVGRASIDTYRARVARAVDDFIAHKTDPQWRPTARQRSTTAPAATKGKALKGKVRVAAHSPPTSPPDAQVYYGGVAGQENALRHRLPLRAGFDVEVLLPRDFSSKEARRVSAWLSALATDQDGPAE